MNNEIKSSSEFKLALEKSTESSLSGVWHWDLQSQHINWSNGFKNLVGLHVDWQVDRDSWKEMIHPDDREQTVTKIKDYLDGKTDRYDNIYRIKHSNGSYRWLHSQGKAAWNAEGTPMIIAGTVKDITDEMIISK